MNLRANGQESSSGWNPFSRMPILKSCSTRSNTISRTDDLRRTNRSLRSREAIKHTRISIACKPPARRRKSAKFDRSLALLPSPPLFNQGARHLRRIPDPSWNPLTRSYPCFQRGTRSFTSSFAHRHQDLARGLWTGPTWRGSQGSAEKPK